MLTLNIMILVYFLFKLFLASLSKLRLRRFCVEGETLFFLSTSPKYCLVLTGTQHECFLV